MKYFIIKIKKKTRNSLERSTQYLIEKGLVVFWNTLYNLTPYLAYKQKCLSLLEKLQNEKCCWNWKQSRYYFSAVFESRVFGWRYDSTTEVGIDRQLCADEGICRWMFKVIDLIGAESVLWIPYMLRYRDMWDHINTDIDIIPRRILHGTYFVLTNKLYPLFFFSLVCKVRR